MPLSSFSSPPSVSSYPSSPRKSPPAARGSPSSPRAASPTYFPPSSVGCWPLQVAIRLSQLCCGSNEFILPFPTPRLLLFHVLPLGLFQAAHLSFQPTRKSWMTRSPQLRNGEKVEREMESTTEEPRNPKNQIVAKQNSHVMHPKIRIIIPGHLDPLMGT